MREENKGEELSITLLDGEQMRRKSVHVAVRGKTDEEEACVRQQVCLSRL